MWRISATERSCREATRRRCAAGRGHGVEGRMAPKNRLALIPARGGSRRVPRKNILDFGGRPMLAWTTEAAQSSCLFSAIVVSTDDEEIAAVATQCGVQVIRRGPDLSHDTATLESVVQDALWRLPGEWDELCLLAANCPLRTAEDIRASLNYFTARGVSAVLSVSSFAWTPPFRAYYLRKTGLEPLFPEWWDRLTQDYPESVCTTGAIYWAPASQLREAPSLYLPGIQGFVMPWYRAIDIDTKEDLEIAQCVRFALDGGFKFEN